MTLDWLMLLAPASGAHAVALALAHPLGDIGPSDGTARIPRLEKKGREKVGDVRRV